MAEPLDFRYTDERGNELRLNPRLSPALQNEFADAFREALPPDLTHHVVLATSGSTEYPRLVALSRAALECAARSVNLCLAVHEQDKWARVLPSFHVGGLSIEIRAQLARIPIFDLPLWQAATFVQEVKAQALTLSALVPAQIFDLVQGRYPAPASLRAVLVGGDALRPELYQAARALGWPLLPSYGMTESGAALAVAELSSLRSDAFPAALKLLPHIEFQTAEPFSFSSPALASGFIQVPEKKWQSLRQPFVTADRVRWDANARSVEFLGRERDFLKILGESVNFFKLKEVFAGVRDPLNLPAELYFTSDERRGQVIVMVWEDGQIATPTEPVRHLVKSFNERVMPFERIEAIYMCPEMPRSSLGKALLSEDLMRRAKRISASDLTKAKL